MGTPWDPGLCPKVAPDSALQLALGLLAVCAQTLQTVECWLLSSDMAGPCCALQAPTLGYITLAGRCSPNPSPCPRSFPPSGSHVLASTSLPGVLRTQPLLGYSTVRPLSCLQFFAVMTTVYMDGFVQMTVSLF